MSGNKYLGKRYAVGTVRMINNQAGNMWQTLVLLEIQTICVLIHCIDMNFPPGIHSQYNHSSGPFYKYWLTLIPIWISTYMPNYVWYEITYEFPKTWAWEWIIIMDVITWAYLD